jgi:predicted transposase YbfD/YdcC
LYRCGPSDGSFRIPRRIKADAGGLVGNSMTIDDAIARATRAHEGQTDKAGQPYIGHLLRVMGGVRIESELEEAAKMAAVLHDVLEDTMVTSADLRSEGCPREVIEAVEAVTKRDGEGLEAYLSRVAANRVAYAVKLADLVDNSDESRLRQLPHEDAERLRRKYETAIGLLQVLRTEALHPSGFYRYYVRDRERLSLLRQWRWRQDGQEAGGVSWPERLSRATGGRWNPGSSSDVDALTGMGPDPYSCGEWADAISEPEARALAAKAALDIDAPRVGTDLRNRSPL